MREHNALKYLPCHDLCIKYAINEGLFDLAILDLEKTRKSQTLKTRTQILKR